MEHDRFGRPLLTFALIVVVATLLILVLAEIAGDRQTAAPAVEDAAVAGWTSGDASSTLVRPPGWIPSGRLPTVVIEYE